MDLIIAFGIFVAAMVAALVIDISMIYALLVGLVCFLAVGAHRGFKMPDLLRMGWEGTKDAGVVIVVISIIGMITASWRISGTITIFVYYGIKLITPSLFLIIAYLLACLLSYSLGTSYGISGTVGVIFMTLAKSGGVNPIITGGVLLSGVYFGDRGSPVSSCANMVAAVTGTKILDNVKSMMKTAVLPFALCCAAYTALSFMNPISSVDADLVRTFEETFSLSPWAFVPAVIILVLPLLKVNIFHTMLVSLTSAVLVACLVQGVPLTEVLRTCIMGYKAPSAGLGEILNGGGFISMVEVLVILAISCAYSGIFTGTGMLDSLQEKLTAVCGRFGRFPVMAAVGMASIIVFCNQTIGVLITNDFMQKPYLDAGASREELMCDIANSTVVFAGIIPWSIGCSVPLALMGAELSSIPFALYLFAVPVIYTFTKRKWFENL